jgi:hypothetical protein
MTSHINIIKQEEEGSSSSWLMHPNFNSSAACQQSFHLHVIIPLQYKYQTENSKAV